MALTKISTAMISQSAAAVDLNVDAGTFYVDTTNNRVGVGGKTDPDTPLHVIGTVTATLFAGSGASLTNIPNSALTNSSITINSTATSLGGSITLTTANIAENTNLYYTNARADARIAAADTDDLSEGSSNLYYTDARVDARISGGSLGNITTTGYIRGPSSFTIDPAAHGDNTGTVVIAGNLQVDGTTTTINSTTMTVDDKNITLASGSANAAAASGAGFTVDIGSGTNPAITYDGTNDEWDFNKPLNVTGTGKFSGDVGVGATPTARFDVRIAGASGKIAEFHQNTGYGIDIGSSQSVAYISSGYNQRLDFKTDPTTGQTERMSILANGNVGIGTTSPSYKLAIRDDSASAYPLSLESATIGTPGNHTGIRFGFAGNTYQKGAIIFEGQDANGRGKMYFAMEGSANSSNADETDAKMTIDYSGNVGIGTSSPSAHANLHIAGAPYAFLTLQATNSGGRQYELFSYAADESFHLYDRTANAYRMTVDETGNVGIGLTDPDQKLDVNGNIRIPNEGKIVFGSAGASPGDYLELNDVSSSGSLLKLVQDSTARLVVQGVTGNVGIGTDNPIAPLHVAGNAVIETGSPDLYFATTSASHTNWRVAAQEVVSQGFEIASGTTSAGSNAVNDTYTTRFVIKSDGNVGIGTTAPSKQLTVSGADAEFLLSRTGSYADTINMGMPSGVPTIVGGTDLAFGGTGTWTEHMRIKADGKVGIGTTSPTSKLSIQSGISGSSTGVIDILQNTNGAQKQAASIGILVDNGGESTNAAGMFFQTASGGSLSERMRLTSSGGLELGYGGAARQQADSQAFSIITPASGGGQGIAFKRLDSNNDQGLGEISWSNNTQDGQANIRVKTAGAVNSTDMHFDVNNAGTLLTALSIDGSAGGNVGIGTTSPNVKLAVDGQLSTGDRRLSLGILDLNSGSTPTQFKIITNIPFASGSADFTVNIKGFRYASNDMVDLSIGWHYYNSTFYSASVKSSGAWAPTVTLGVENSKVVIHLAGPGYWPKLYVESMYSSAYRDSYAAGWSWSDSAISSDSGTPTVSPAYSSNFGNNFVMLDNGNVGIGTTAPGALFDINKVGDGTVARLGLQGVCDWDFSIGNTPTGTNGSSGDLELIPQNGNMGFAVLRAGQSAINMRVRDGVMTLGSGIKFNSDTAAANMLDDYEEGTWTPVLAAHSGTSPTISGTNYGSYTKVGRLVSVIVELNVTAISGVTSGYITCSLPFTAAVGAGYYSQGSQTNSSVAWARPENVGPTLYNATKFGFLSSDNAGGGWGWEAFGAFSGNEIMRISFSYYAT